MKSTGIVRKIDDLGRIVIPKEIRRTINIAEGEAMEIYLDNGYILLKKYNQIESTAKALCTYITNEKKIKNRELLLEKLEEINNLLKKESQEIKIKQ